MNNKATVSDDYYRKFLTTKDKTEEIAISNQQPTQKQTTINTQDYSQQPQKTDISQMTYSLFVNQTKELLYKNFFKNKTSPPKPQRKQNQFKTIANKEITADKKQFSKKSNEINPNKEKKKEFLEEIIKVNSDVIRPTNFYFQQKQYEFEEPKPKRFDLEQFQCNQEVAVEIENEVENKRKLIEQEHEEIINANVPNIVNSIEELINNSEKPFYFVQPKYDKLIEEYSSI